MNRFFSFPLLLLLLVVAGGWLWHAWSFGSAERRETLSHEAISDLVEKRSHAVQPDSREHPGKIPAARTEALEEEVELAGRVHWLDPEGKAVRRRVRIERIVGKYPLVRKLEEVSRERESGEERSRLIHASVADHVLVGLKTGVEEAAVREALRARGFVVRGSERDSFLLVEVANADEMEAQEQSLRALAALDEFIEFSEPDYLVWPTVLPNDQAVQQGLLWALDNQGDEWGQKLDADIDAREGWDTRSTAPEVVVAVIDTGIHYLHEDLAPNMWVNGGEIPADGNDNDGNGIVDDIHGFDSEDNDGDPSDINGHGTHVAGTIGARGNNGLGSSGVAWEVQLMGLKFLSNGPGATSDAIRAINYARLNSASIINASWGGGGFSDGLRNAIEACGEAGIVFVTAAGNDASDNDAAPQYPSSYDLPNIVSVAATTSEDRLSHFSNYGRYSVDLAAPGSGIWSSFHRSTSDYRLQNGTSMAAPHVAGALALAKAQFPGESVEQLVARLISSVDQLASLENQVFTEGRLNLQKLLEESDPGLEHDDLARALRFQGAYGYWSGSNAQATREADEDQFSRPGTGRRSVWFAWQAPHDGAAELEVLSPGRSLRAIVFRGGERDGLVVETDDGGSSEHELLRFHALAGQDYRIVIDGNSLLGERFTTELLLRPENDQLSDAIPLTGDRFTALATNRGATAEALEVQAPHAGVGTGQSVWWRWTPEQGGAYVVSTRGSAFDTVLAVYAGGPGALLEVESNDDSNPFDWSSEVAFTAEAGTTYHVAVDSYRASQRGVIVLNGYQAGQLAFLQDLESLTVRPGQRAILDVVMNSDEGVVFEWLKDGAPVPFERNARLTFDRVVGEDAANYQVVARRGNETLSSQSVELMVADEPPELVWRSSDQAVAIGEHVSLQVIAFGSGTLNYQWYHDGVLLAGATEATLTLEGVQEGDTGFYEVEVHNSFGSVVAPEIEVVAQERPWGTWTWVRPRPFSETITGMDYLNGRFIGHATGAVVHSTDGENWRSAPLPRTQDMVRSAAYGNGIWVFGTEGRGGHIYSSADLSDFTDHALGNEGTSYNIAEIEFGAGLFVARSGRDILVSADGVNWNQTLDVGDGNELEDLALGAGRFVVKTTGTTSYWSENGIDWQEEVGAPDGEGILEFLEGKFRFWDSKGPSTYYTSDLGVNWDAGVPHNAPASKNGTGRGRVIRMDGRYGLVSGGSSVSVSENGANWGRKNLGVGVYSIRGIAQSDGQVVVAGRPGTVGRGDSFDDLVLDPNPYDFNSCGVQFLNGEFVHASASGVHGFSAQGDQWQFYRPHTGFQFSPHDLTYAFGKYWSLHGNVGGPNNHKIRVGTSPRDLETKSLGGTFYLTEIVAGGGKMVGLAGNRDLYVTSDGETWTNSGVTITCRSPLNVYYLRGLFLVMCEHEFLVSPDGVNWSTVNPAGLAPFSAEYQAACDAFGKICVISTRGDVCTSDDGVNWNSSSIVLEYPPNINDPQVRAAGNENSIVLVYGPGRIQFTTDLVNWVDEPAPAPSISGVDYGNGSYVLHGVAFGEICHGTLRDPIPRIELGNEVNETVFLRNSASLDLGMELIDPAGSLERVDIYSNGILVQSGTEDLTLDLYDLEAGSHDLRIEAVSQSGAVSRVRASFELQEGGYSRLVSNPSWVTAVARINGLPVVGDNQGRLFSREPSGAWREFSLPKAEPIEAIRELAGTIYVTTATSTFRSEDFANFELVGPAFRDMAGGELGFVGLKDEQRDVLFYSLNGRSWRETVVEGSAVAMGNGALAVGGLRSEDGQTFRSPAEGSMAERVIFLEGRFYTSGELGSKGVIRVSEDADHWQTVLEFDPFEIRGDTVDEVGFVVHSGGRFFATAARSDHWLAFTSLDGLNWEPIPEPVEWVEDRSSVEYAEGAWWLSSEDGIYHSDDGVNWSLAVETPRRSQWENPFLIGDDTGLTIINVYRELGEIDPASGEIVERGLVGENDWPRDPVNPLSISRVAGGAGVYFVTAGQRFRTIDFQSFEPADPSLLPNLINDGTGFVGLRSNGEFQTSPDGLTWTLGPTIGLAENERLSGSVMNGGTVVSGSGGVSVANLFVFTGGEEWASFGVEQLTGNESEGVRKVGWLDGLFWAFTTKNVLLTSATGLDWTVAARDAAYLPVAKLGSRYIARKERGSKLEVSEDLQSWDSIDGPQVSSHDTTGLVFHDGVLYLSSENGDVWTTTDLEHWQRSGLSNDDVHLVQAGNDLLALTQGVIFGRCEDRDYFAEFSLANPGTQFGIGDLLELNLVRVNRGSESLPGTEDVPLEVVISGDGLLGGVDDLVLGAELVSFGELAPGESESYDLAFILPPNLTAGNFHLFARALKPCAIGIGRRTLLARTAGDALVVPEWELALVINGEGDVEADIAQLRFVHNSTVSLTANAAKGARFAGWGGDGVGGLNQVTILMNGPRTVEATFVPVSSLQVFLRGAGQVAGISDGGSYAVGAEAVLEARPDPAWIFAGWEGAVVDSEISISLTMDESRTLTAHFVLPLENWRGRHFNAAELLDLSFSGDEADPDGDGLSNVREYVHGSDPRDGRDRGSERVLVRGGYLTMIYTRLQGMEEGYQLRVRGSRDHQIWNETVEERILSVSEGVETREARLPLAGRRHGFLGFDYAEAPVALSLSEWKESHFSAVELADPQLAGDEVDPDFDGLLNWQEFLHGSDPRDPVSRGELRWWRDGEDLVMTFTRRAELPPGYQLLGEGSRDLSVWTVAETREFVRTTLLGVQSVDARLGLAAGESGYLRLRYKRP